MEHLSLDCRTELAFAAEEITSENINNNFEMTMAIIANLASSCASDIQKILANPQFFNEHALNFAQHSGIVLDSFKDLKKHPALTDIPPVIKKDIIDFEKFAEGFIATFNYDFNLPDYDYCLEAIVNATNTYDEAQAYFNQNTIAGFLKGFGELGYLYEYLGQAIYSCGQSEQAAKKRVE